MTTDGKWVGRMASNFKSTYLYFGPNRIHQQPVISICHLSSNSSIKALISDYNAVHSMKAFSKLKLLQNRKKKQILHHFNVQAFFNQMH